MALRSARWGPRRGVEWAMRSAGVVLAVVVMLGACGDNLVGIEVFEDRLQAAYCESLVRRGSMPDFATCVASTRVATASLDTLVSDVNAKIVKYDASAATACVDYVASHGWAFGPFDNESPCPLGVDCSPPMLPDPGPCSDVFAGTLAIGAPCFVTGECNPGGTIDGAYCSRETCDPTTDCCMGICTPDTAMDCPYLGCPGGMYCAVSTTAVPTCKPNGEVGDEAGGPRGKLGAPCDGSFSSCASGMYCAVSVGSTTGVCQSAAAIGQACDPTLPACSSYGPCCVYDGWCDPSTATCQPPQPVGAACIPNLTYCVAGAQCDGTTCRKIPLAGDPCDPTGADAFASCESPLQCTGTPPVCTLPPPPAACF